MKILLTPKAYLKLKYYVLGCEDEISGIGQSEYINQDTIRIKDILIFKQDVSSASTDLNKEEVALFLTKKNNEKANISQFNVWWHSHADMGTFWSSTDEETINSFLTDNYIVALETNHRLDFKARIDIFKPFRNTIEDISVEIEMEDKKLLKQITKEIKEKISDSFGFNKEEEPNEYGTEIATTEDLEKSQSDWKDFDNLEMRLINGDELMEYEHNKYIKLYHDFYGNDDYNYMPHNHAIQGRSVRRKKQRLISV